MTMITPSYLGETIEYSSLHACRSTLEDPTVAIGYHSSKLSRAEMSEMIEMMFEYGARHGVEFDDERRAA